MVTVCVTEDLKHEDLKERGSDQSVSKSPVRYSYRSASIGATLLASRAGR